jgi:alpha-ketoglutarate-dependent taurine dioxygenase
VDKTVQEKLHNTGFCIIQMDINLSWSIVVQNVGNLLNQEIFGFDGTTDCYGVNYVELGKGNYRSSTSVALGLHQEGYETEDRPQYIAFYCLKSVGEGGQTLIADSQPVITKLNRDFLSELNQAEIRFCKLKNREIWTPWRKLIEKTPNQETIIRFAEPEAGFRSVEIRGLSSDLIEQLTKGFKENTTVHSWEDGQLLIIDNYRCLHGRNEIIGEAERCLLRLAF